MKYLGMGGCHFRSTNFISQSEHCLKACNFRIKSWHNGISYCQKILGLYFGRELDERERFDCVSCRIKQPKTGERSVLKF